MRRPLSYASLAATFLFALICIAWGPAFALPVPLYLTDGCPGSYCYSNVPRLWVIPLVAGVLLMAVTDRGLLLDRRALIRGLALGAGAQLAVGVLVSASVPFTEAYFTTPYRAYGLLYLAIATALATWWCARTLRSPVAPQGSWLAAPLTAVITLSGVAAIIADDRLPGLVALGAAAVGAVFGVSGVRLPAAVRVLTEQRLMLGLAAIAFLARAAFGLQTLLRTGPGLAFAVASDDGDSYYTLASKAAADPRAIGDMLGALAYPPGYSIFLATILALTRDLMFVVIAQALLAAFATGIVFLIARSLAGTGPALLATTLFALDQNLVQNEATLTAEALLMPLALVSLWALATYGRTRRTRWLLIGAAALGGVFLTRNVVAFPLFIAVVLWLWWLDRSSFGRLAREMLVLVAAIVIASMPVAIASTIREGSPRLTTQLAATQWNFVAGTEGYTISNKFLIDRGIDPFTDPLGSAGRVLTDPLPVIGFLVGAAPQRLSTLLFFTSFGLSDPLLIVNNIFYPNSFGDLVRIARLIGLIVAIVAIFRTRAWETHRELVLFGVFVAFYLAAFVFVFPPYHAFRYRIPIEPLRFVAEAAGLIIVARFAMDAWRFSAAEAAAARTDARAVGHA